MVDSIPSVPAETAILKDDDCCSGTPRSEYHRRNAKDGGISPVAMTLNTALTAADSHYPPRPFNPGNLYEDDGNPTAATADTKVLPHMAKDVSSRPCYLHDHHDHIRQDDDSSQDTFASSSHRQYNNIAVFPSITSDHERICNSTNSDNGNQSKSLHASESLQGCPPNDKDRSNDKLHLPSYRSSNDRDNVLRDKAPPSSPPVTKQQDSATDWWDFYMAKNGMKDGSNINRIPSASSTIPHPTIPTTPETYTSRLVLAGDHDTVVTLDNKFLPHMAKDVYSRPYYDTHVSGSHRQYNNTAVSPDNLGSITSDHERICNSTNSDNGNQSKSLHALESLQGCPPNDKDRSNDKLHLPSYPSSNDKDNVLRDEAPPSSPPVTKQQDSATDWWDFYMAKNGMKDGSNINRIPSASSTIPHPTIPTTPETYTSRLVLAGDHDSSFWQTRSYRNSHQKDPNRNSIACRVRGEGYNEMATNSQINFSDLRDQQRRYYHASSSAVVPFSMSRQQRERYDAESRNFPSTLIRPSWCNNSFTLTSVHSKSLPSDSYALQPYYNRQIRTLSIEDDDRHLSGFLCFVRSQCVEVFSARINSSKVTMGQAGIRCRFCAHFPSRKRSGRSSSFPSSTSRIYQSLTMMLRDHFAKCLGMPLQVQETYHKLKANASKGRTDSKKYWIESANAIGLFDTAKNGMHLYPQQYDDS
eukprot:scaffold71_cov265-Chaetoceros_neogracile.AAC.31